MAIRIFHRDGPSLRLPMISKDARIVVWPGVGAWDATLGYVRMEPGEANVPHVHESSEDTIFILEGTGTAHDYDAGKELRFHAGCVVHVPPGVKHAVRADPDCGVTSVGGPAPADIQLLKRIGAL
ncbi:quercetin dioxygenase-like cupin family protein [Methylobacterium sp. PvP062]|uniref:Quercetin dioxygenase-like cupin family protein n=2 Tax=Methylobacteriaceae TaxID=119045 RepID=A0ABV2NUE2_9HYPH|nr:quercetin dioxygenase-like cupin family protein [Methylobacterium sp. PvP105]MBP2505678.1 quercetin dioxygenase-like cupin family protein [Methylobacterium sp. PvP109]